MNDSRLRRRIRQLIAEAITESFGSASVAIEDLEAALGDDHADIEANRFDDAFDWLINNVDPNDFAGPFFDYCDGLLTMKELRDESVSRETRLRRRVRAEAEGRL